MRNPSEKLGRKPPVFIDVFAGCGGLSLGLMRAGWQGLFAIERDRFAYDTLEANLLAQGSRYRYDWPSWLAKAPWDVEDLFAKHIDSLKELRGKVDLLAGGPPCQGFSYAGLRKLDDPRNHLVERYIELVHILEPKIVLLENVRGFTSDFQGGKDVEPKNFSSLLMKKLRKKYQVRTAILHAARFGVPQGRARFFLVAFLKGSEMKWPAGSPFAALRAARATVLAKKGIPKRVSSKSAISDLETRRNGKKPCPDCKGFEAIAYKTPKTSFQLSMRDGYEGPPSDTRLARHRQDISIRFKSIINDCVAGNRLNVALSREMREKYGLKKMAMRVLDPRKPAPTITSMPDDLLHYSEPRTLTVRETARLQTFPDWFVFKGKYTTGGERRRLEVPRFTQVANAVPPLLAEMFGDALMKYHLNLQSPKCRN